MAIAVLYANPGQPDWLDEAMAIKNKGFGYFTDKVSAKLDSAFSSSLSTSGQRVKTTGETIFNNLEIGVGALSNPDATVEDMNAAFDGIVNNTLDGAKDVLYDAMPETIKVAWDSIDEAVDTVDSLEKKAEFVREQFAEIPELIDETYTEYFGRDENAAFITQNDLLDAEAQLHPDPMDQAQNSASPGWDEEQFSLESDMDDRDWAGEYLLEEDTVASLDNESTQFSVSELFEDKREELGIPIGAMIYDEEDWDPYAAERAEVYENEEDYEWAEADTSFGREGMDYPDYALLDDEADALSYQEVYEQYENAALEARLDTNLEDQEPGQTVNRQSEFDLAEISSQLDLALNEVLNEQEGQLRTDHRFDVGAVREAERSAAALGSEAASRSSSTALLSALQGANTVISMANGQSPPPYFPPPGSMSGGGTMAGSISMDKYGNGNCPTNLGHLSSLLPNYNDPDLRELRNSALSTDMQSVLREAQAMGYSATEAANLSFQQAEAYQDGLRQSEECIRQSASDPSAMMWTLQNGSFDFSTDSIVSSCAKSYVTHSYGIIVNQESGAILKCMAGP